MKAGGGGELKQAQAACEERAARQFWKGTKKPKNAFKNKGVEVGGERKAKAPDGTELQMIVLPAQIYGGGAKKPNAQVGGEEKRA